MDQQAWDQAVRATPGGSFLQSWGWGELQTELKNTFWRLQEGDGLALVIQRPLRLGKHWLYVPRGPIATSPETARKIREHISELAKEQRSIFTRIEPGVSATDVTDAEAIAEVSVLSGEGWRLAPASVQPSHTLVLDLTLSEEQLLTAMHHKTRYNIKVAQRKGVTVRFSREQEDIEHFIRLAGDVAERQSFHYHPPDYYRAFMRVLHHYGAEIALAEHEGKVLAANIMMTFGDTTTYVHGASSSEERSLMAPYVLQWEAIKQAQQGSSTRYDFYGVAPADAAPDHPWTGITRFKLGFGGYRQEYPGAFDLVQSKLWYLAYKTARALKRQ